MKWNKPDGGVQHSTDGRYTIHRATTAPEKWIAYALSAFGTTAEKVAEVDTDEEARQWCDEHEALARAMQRQSA
jgi:hypothetical protein